MALRPGPGLGTPVPGTPGRSCAAPWRCCPPGDTLAIYKPDRVARSMKVLVLLEDQLQAC